MNEQQSTLDMTNIKKLELVDMKGYTLDPEIPLHEREKRLREKCPDLYCYRVGTVGVSIEFTDDGPAIQDLLTDIMVRQKTGA